jgi:undecaprenyl-diphosphatase
MDRLDSFDLGTLYWFGSQHRPWLDRLAANLSLLGDFRTLMAFTLLSAVAFLAVRRPRQAGTLVACGLLAWLLEWGTKLLVHRPRPDMAWRLIDLPNEYSFPSGHALASMAIYGAFALLLAPLFPRRPLRFLVLTLGFLLPLLIGLTRPYLGVHYPTDVFAGWCAGLACALLAGEIGNKS